MSQDTQQEVLGQEGRLTQATRRLEIEAVDGSYAEASASTEPRHVLRM